jgi:metal-responsive CopG/Arc/MetJ family transcriptional regulator
VKTAISIPDDVFEAAEAAARRAGMSRSQFFTTAIKMFLGRQGDQSVTDCLSDVYSRVDSRVDPVLRHLQFGAAERRDRW